MIEKLELRSATKIHAQDVLLCAQQYSGKQAEVLNISEEMQGMAEQRWTSTANSRAVRDDW